MKNINDFMKMKLNKEKISMITAYDFIQAEIAKEAGIDIILVGDSVATTVQGKENTLSVTVDEIVYHTKLVKAGAKDVFIIADMPFMSYQVGEKEALINAGRFIKEGGANAVKIEGGSLIKETVKKIVNAGIPVVAHIGLMPQFINALGGYKVQGRTESEAEALVDDAIELEKAGAFMILLEAMPEQTALVIQKAVNIPTIGIGAGRYTDAQVLVFYDVVGMLAGKPPKFVKKYLDSRSLLIKALSDFKDETKKGLFPSEENIYK
jgi:3-methyl-2-oxobutanoate hydroxymethyltransferase